VGRTRDAKTRSETIEKNNMVNGIKGSTKQCMQAIFSMRRVIERYAMNGSKVNICALDLTEAFDKINHHGLFIKLIRRNIPVQLLAVIEYWFSSG